VMAELLLRWFVPNVNMQVGGMYVEQPEGVRLKPGWTGRVHTREFAADIAISKDGLRSPPLDGAKHLVVLGDSFTFGCWSPEDRTWLARAEGVLGVPVARAGQPNAGTDLALQILRTRGDEMHPSAVVLAFFNGNDFVDNYVGKDAYTVDGGFLVMKDGPARYLSEYDCLSGTPPGNGMADAPHVEAGFFGGLLRHSAVFQFGAGLWTVLTRPRGAVRLNEPGAWCLKSYTAEMEQAVEKTRTDLDGVLEESRRRGVPMVLVSIPSKVEVYDVDLKAWLEFRGLSADLFDVSRPSALLRAWASERGVPFLDLRPAFLGRPRMYYERDMHWNDAGHAQAGEKLSDFLKHEGIVR